MHAADHVANGILAAGLIALACERVRKLVGRSPRAAALLVPECWLIREGAAPRFHGAAFATVLALSAATVLALAWVKRRDPRLTLVDFAVGVMLFLPLDLRWTNPLGGGYHFWALALTYLAVVGWGCAPRALPDFGYRAPRREDVAYGLAGLVAFGALAIPLGLGLGFLKKTAHPKGFDAAQAVLSAIGYVFVVALPEEVFFRGVLDRGLQATLRSPYGALLASSLLFGLMHVPRRNDLKSAIAYVVMATVAGIFYALVYRRSGGLPAAVICHASVDWVWEQLWKR